MLIIDALDPYIDFKHVKKIMKQNVYIIITFIYFILYGVYLAFGGSNEALSASLVMILLFCTLYIGTITLQKALADPCYNFTLDTSTLLTVTLSFIYVIFSTICCFIVNIMILYLSCYIIYMAIRAHTNNDDIYIFKLLPYYATGFIAVITCIYIILVVKKRTFRLVTYKPLYLLNFIYLFIFSLTFFYVTACAFNITAHFIPKLNYPFVTFLPKAFNYLSLKKVIFTLSEVNTTHTWYIGIAILVLIIFYCYFALKPFDVLKVCSHPESHVAKYNCFVTRFTFGIHMIYLILAGIVFYYIHLPNIL
jgi:hypothetical protein